MKKTFTSLVLMLLPILGLADTPGGELIFSISLIEGAFTGVHTNKSGIFVYHDNSNSNIIGYRYKHGKVVDVFGGGYRGKQLLEELNAIRIPPFDFEEEVESAKLQEKKQTGRQKGIIALDGAKQKIFYSFNGSYFTYTGWNPGAKLLYYSAYSENISNLNRVIDLFAGYYGRQQFGL